MWSQHQSCKLQPAHCCLTHNHKHILCSAICVDYSSQHALTCTPSSSLLRRSLSLPLVWRCATLSVLVVVEEISILVSRWVDVMSQECRCVQIRCISIHFFCPIYLHAEPQGRGIRMICMLCFLNLVFLSSLCYSFFIWILKIWSWTLLKTFSKTYLDLKQQIYCQPSQTKIKININQSLPMFRNLIKWPGTV